MYVQQGLMLSFQEILGSAARAKASLTSGFVVAELQI